GGGRGGARFGVALRLTTDTGMSVTRALRLSLRATGNGAFVAAIPMVESGVRAGDDLTLALGRTGLLPEDFQHMLAIAEESGTLHDVLRHQGDHYHDEASRRLAFLTSLASYAVWLLTGGFIIIAIFRMYSS